MPKKPSRNPGDMNPVGHSADEDESPDEVAPAAPPDPTSEQRGEQPIARPQDGYKTSRGFLRKDN